MNLLSACNDKFKMKTLTMNGYLRVNIKYIYKNTGLKYVIKESLVVSFGIFFNSLYVSIPSPWPVGKYSQFVR